MIQRLEVQLGGQLNKKRVNFELLTLNRIVLPLPQPRFAEAPSAPGFETLQARLPPHDLRPAPVAPFQTFGGASPPVTRSRKAPPPTNRASWFRPMRRILKVGRLPCPTPGVKRTPVSRLTAPRLQNRMLRQRAPDRGHPSLEAGSPRPRVSLSVADRVAAPEAPLSRARTALFGRLSSRTGSLHPRAARPGASVEVPTGGGRPGPALSPWEPLRRREGPPAGPWPSPSVRNRPARASPPGPRGAETPVGRSGGTRHAQRPDRKSAPGVPIRFPKC
jgi:hypothetical protein